MARPKTLITDFRHLPEVATDEFVTGRSLPAFLAGVVAIGSLEGPKARVRSPMRCRCRPARRACPGVILIARYPRHSEIEWRCSECAFNGIITHWEGSTWDHQPPARKQAQRGPSVLRLVKPTGFEGRWLIEEVLPEPRSFASDTPVDVDSLGTPHLEFSQQSGSMRFARLEGSLDCRYSTDQVDFCWFGDEDTKQLIGRGFARLDGAVMRGQVFTFGKADLTFVARRFRDGEPMDLSRRDKLDEGW